MTTVFSLCLQSVALWNYYKHFSQCGCVSLTNHKPARKLQWKSSESRRQKWYSHILLTAQHIEITNTLHHCHACAVLKGDFMPKSSLHWVWRRNWAESSPPNLQAYNLSWRGHSWAWSPAYHLQEIKHPILSPSQSSMCLPEDCTLPPSSLHSPWAEVH